MTTGRKPKPTALHRLEGTRPERRRTAEPRIEGSTSCPRWLTGAARREWKRLAPILAASGILTPADRSTLAAHCQAVADVERAVAEVEAFAAKHGSRYYKSGCGSLRPHPALVQLRSACEMLLRTAAELGCTPSARSRVAAVQVPVEDQLSEYLATGGPLPVTATADKLQ